jgi:ABC-type molybdate transport system substrate-binding protein
MIRKLIIASLFLAATNTFAGEVQIAVAANFGAPAKQIAADFEKETGHQNSDYRLGLPALFTPRSKRRSF